MTRGFHLRPCPRHRPPRADGFALILTMIILSVLVLVAVSYLASMSAERGTADAFANKARAEAAARAGADAAMATLRENFRLFPDSVTAWDSTQTQSVVTQPDGSTQNVANEGTSLYLRAAPTGTSPVVPDSSATADNRPPFSGGASTVDGRRNFVLPLVSGVPKGQARLVSEKGSIFPVFPASDSDSKSKDFEKTSTDLNARRYKDDKQGIIGSPPGWENPPPTLPAPTGPKPARAPWVEVKDDAGLTLSRYAFFMEDESFKAPVNLAGALSREDNTAQLGTPANPRPFGPTDLNLAGPLAALDSPSPAPAPDDATGIITVRNTYPAKFLPDSRSYLQANLHTPGAAAYPDIYGDHNLSPTQKAALALARYKDEIGYLTSTNSGTLNLSRHGSQRLNLNASSTVNRTAPVTMLEIRKLVETMRFHLPSLGQRFYRNTVPDQTPALSATARATLLNKADDVSTNHAEVYYYKIAANLRDYLDTDLQPTIIVSHLPPPAPPFAAPPVLGPTSVEYALGGDGKGGNGPNGPYVWAQGKESAPFLQEAVVRYRPVVNATANTYTLKVDYYLEFWNMSDRKVTARDLGQPFVRIKNQQGWVGATLKPASTPPTTADLAEEPIFLGPLETADADGITPNDNKHLNNDLDILERDFNIDLLNNVVADAGNNVADGVVFNAGQATVITTDPNYATIKDSYYFYGGQKVSPSPGKGVNTANIYYCPGSPTMPTGKRVFTGPLPTDPDPTHKNYNRGIMPIFRDGKNTSTPPVALDYEMEVSLGNERGYLDWAIGPVAISAGRNPEKYDFTSAVSGANSNDYVHGGSLFGNSTTTSQLGDPRTNNEQLNVALFGGNSSTQPDQTRYATPGTSDNPPYALGLPNSKYTLPAGNSLYNKGGAGTGNPWPDYWDWASTAYPTTNPTALTAPAVIADGALTSIGQLGDLFDPARLPGVDKNNAAVGTAGIGGSRGGGRTFKIGQRDDRYTADPTPNPNLDAIPASNGWAAWRLTDVFGIDDAMRLPARINLNGVTRDNGAALRSALTGFKFQTQTGGDPLIHGDHLLAGKDLNLDPAAAGGLTELIAALKARLNPAAATPITATTLPRPLFERGELGELGTGVTALFGMNSTSGVVTNSKLVPGVDMNKSYDRGREEVFRRLVETSCTRGDTFTVHCVGQSILQPNLQAPKRVTSTHRLRVTFRLVPKLANGSPFQPGATTNTDGSLTPTEFTPDDPKSVADRFAKPDHYDVQILQSSTAPF